MTHARSMYPVIVIVTLLAILIASDARSSESMERDLPFTVTGDNLEIRITGDFAELDIQPSSSGKSGNASLEWNNERCNIEMNYNKKKNRLTIDIDADWKKKSSGDNSDSCHSCSPDIELSIDVPTDPALRLSIDLHASESTLRLGGLSLERFKIENKAGETTIDFEEPNRIGCRNFEIDCLAGELNLRNLGNARIENGDINGLVGELDINFCGSAPMDAYFDIDLDIGETNIEIPSDLGTRLTYSKFPLLSNVSIPCEMTKMGRKRYESQYESAERRLSMHISTGIGECDIKTTASCVTHR